jgi:hypothetical protein
VFCLFSKNKPNTVHERSEHSPAKKTQSTACWQHCYVYHTYIHVLLQTRIVIRTSMLPILSQLYKLPLRPPHIYRGAKYSSDSFTDGSTKLTCFENVFHTHLQLAHNETWKMAYRVETLRIPHCLDNRLIDGGKVVSPTHQPHFTPQKHFFLCFRYSFLLEAE